jgi:uncharacterized protein YbcI
MDLPPETGRAAGEPSLGTSSNGERLALISEAIVGIYRDHFGKGPTQVKTYALDDLVICVLRNGTSILEKTLNEGGQAGAVRALRSAFQEAVKARLTTVVEELTGRQVVAFMSEVHLDPAIAIETFILDRPLNGDGRAVAKPSLRDALTT